MLRLRDNIIAAVEGSNCVYSSYIVTDEGGDYAVDSVEARKSVSKVGK